MKVSGAVNAAVMEGCIPVDLIQVVGSKQKKSTAIGTTSQNSFYIKGPTP